MTSCAPPRPRLRKRCVRRTPLFVSVATNSRCCCRRPTPSKPWPSAGVLKPFFAETLHAMPLNVNVNMDHGVATFPQDGEQADQLIRVADERLYRLKHANHRKLGDGTNTVAPASPALGAHSNDSSGNCGGACGARGTAGTPSSAAKPQRNPFRLSRAAADPKSKNRQWRQPHRRVPRKYPQVSPARCLPRPRRSESTPCSARRNAYP